MDTENTSSWLKRVEDLIHVLEGSSIGELELVEAGTEIIIRRSPGMVLVSAPTQVSGTILNGEQPVSSRSRSPQKEGVAIVTPMTGVYYSAASPTTPPFANVGDIVQSGQVVALVEAMKVFNEIQSEVAGRVIALVATNGDVVQKGDVLLRVEPL